MPSVRIVDVRASASGGFIPGAVRLDDAAAVGVGVKADPGIAEFAFAMARHGVDNGDFVVVYDRGGDGRAVRLARTLGRFGHTAVAVLSGGFERWLAERGPTDALPVAPRPASFTARRVGG